MHHRLCLAFFILASATIFASPPVYIERVPDNGIQPRLISDSDGGIHLLYFKKTNGRSGNLFYREFVRPGKWSSAQKVSQPFTHHDAIARASMAIDEFKRLHIVWLVADPPQYLYTRSSEGGTFEQPRSLKIEHLDGIEAAASIATHANQVAVTWHAGTLEAESSRQVYSLDSSDGGASFTREAAISDPGLGACACCGLASTYKPDGRLSIAYRSAIQDTGRHMQLLSGSLESTKWQTKTLSEWHSSTCPVSSSAMHDNWLVFETRGKLYRSDSKHRPMRVSSNSEDRQKHPAIAINSSGQQLIAWGEGPGYFSGGALEIALFDAQFQIMETASTSGMVIPEFSAAAVVTIKDVGFLVMY